MRHLHCSLWLLAHWSALACGCLLAACAASTRVTLTPSPQVPVCQKSASALVLWGTKWRPDQKDVPEREAAASAGIDLFFRGSGCFASAELRRLTGFSEPAIRAERTSARSHYDRVLVVAVRELGPVVKLLSSSALVEGGTEVVLDVTEYRMPGVSPAREFAVHWQNGGPGVVKGVGTLREDMQAALAAGLQASGGPR
jgi:hypothetical protein